MKKHLSLLTSGLLILSTAFSQNTPNGTLGGQVLITQTQNSVDKTFKDFSMYSPHGFLNGSVMTTFNNSENTKGRRYFFDNWAKGTLTGASGKTIQADSFQFNLDKITNGLLVTVDKKNIIEVSREAISSFRLTGDGQTYSFIKMPAINPDKFMQVLTDKEKGYALYKVLNTHLVKANYTTNGITEYGNPYDEYVDAAQYYVRLPGDKGIKVIALKKKNIREVLSTDASKVNDWFAQYDPDEITEEFLKNLIENLNQ